MFVTPERITGKSANSKSFQTLLKNMYAEDKIDRFVLDEIHCVKSWGEDFRPAYSHLSSLKEKYPKVPILGLTATATLQVRGDVAKRLGFESNFLIFQSSFNRPNITIKIEQKPKE